MQELTSVSNLECFLLRLDRICPPATWSGSFDLLCAAAVLEAHLEFLAKLNPAAAAPHRRIRLEAEIAGLQREVLRLQSCLLTLWNSSTLSISSKKTREVFESGSRIYARALGRGSALMALILPCSASWYDATVGRQ